MDEITKVIEDLRRENNRFDLLLIGQNQIDARETRKKILNNLIEIKNLKKQASARTN